MAKKDDAGIRQVGPNKFEIRVKRREARTGLVVNRKATISGTKADARRERDRLRSELSSTVEKRPRTRLKQYATSWLARRASNGELKPSVVRKYGYGLQHILPELGDLYIDTITPTDVEAYVGKRKKVAAGNTVLNELRLLRTIARDTVGEGYTTRYWCDRVRPPKTKKYSKEKPNRFTPPQAQKVLAKVPPRWLGMVWLMITTGLRWGEASALHWEDIVIRKIKAKRPDARGELVEKTVLAGEATIKWGNDRGRLVSVKTDSSVRTVPVLPHVLELLGLRREKGLVFPNRRGPSKGELCRGYPLVNMLKRVCKEVGVPYTTPHGLRRTFNNMARTEAGREVVMAITGHSTDEMMEHYSFIETDEKHAASSAVAARLTAPIVAPDPSLIMTSADAPGAPAEAAPMEASDEDSHGATEDTDPANPEGSPLDADTFENTKVGVPNVSPDEESEESK